MTNEARAAEARELRSISEFEARQQADGSWKVGGYASTFNDPYEVHDRFGTFSETIMPGTWDRTLSERGHKIQLLASHGGLPYASTKSKSLRFSTDAHGLLWDWNVGADSQRSQDVAVGIRDGYIDEMSVGMRVLKSGDQWNADMTERTVSEASLLEISVVARGANPNTEASMREAELLAEIRELRAAMTPNGGLVAGGAAYHVGDAGPELFVPAGTDEPVTLDANVDALRAVLLQHQVRVPITQELARLLELRK